METNKVEAFGKVLIDLTNDTVTPSAMVQGVTAHDRSGAIIEGELDWNSKQDVIDDLDTIRDNSELATWIVPGGVVKEYTSDMQAKPGDCVAYNGAVWRSLGWSMGWTPGDPSGDEPRMWEKISLTTLGNKTANLITTDGTHTNDTRLAIDPNAQELEFVTSDEIDALSQKIDNAMSLSCNRNMLDNWYFGNPVNQRGLAKANQNMDWPVDRWQLRLVSEHTPKYVGYDSTKGCFTFDATNGSAFLYQVLPSNVNRIVGKEVTFSLLTGDGALYLKTFTFGNVGNMPLTEGMLIDVSYAAPVQGLSQMFQLGIAVTGGYSVDILGVKLELGSRQTLAHMENGQWVLNEIPDFGEQLMRCQRYFLVGGNFFELHQMDSNSTVYMGNYFFPVTMAGNPSVSYSVAAGSVVGVDSTPNRCRIQGESAGWMVLDNLTFTIAGLGG